ncbi:ATP-binding protein [Nocardia sp. NPDC051570]|uniref:ATP-binding protein n=1 Tax=Nocardia sp. NPDC051570 TaxID=3364324 RepID=UPI00378F1198
MTTALRRDIHTFVGRDSEVQRILDAAGPGRVVSIHTVDGMPGIGKTALVTRAAHLLADRFPDGRFFVELNTHTPGQVPTDPADVLATLLTHLGIAPSHIPDSLDARRDLWRDRLSAKRALVVLDDARDHTQIEPLLPTGPECLTLITSRRRLIALDGALPMTLATLDPDSAIDLFYRLANRGPNNDDATAAAELVRLCGYLPLAIVLLAGRLAHHPAWTLTGLAAEFATTQNRLDELDTGQRAVHAAFTASYEDLPADRQWVFRRLGLHPGSDFDAHAVAALNDIPLTTARYELDALYTDHLIDETAPGRYRLHDLLREFARTLAATDSSGDNRRAVERLLDYYQHTGAAADRWLASYPLPTDDQHTAVTTGAVAREFENAMRALAWMRIERTNLLACLEYTAEHDHARMVRLTKVLAEMLERDGPWQLALQLHRRAAEAADHLDNRLGQTTALTNLSIVQWRTGIYEHAIGLQQQALTQYQELGNLLGQATALTNLGFMHRETGDYEQATALLQQALTRYRELDNRLGQATALANLGLVYRETGDYEQATALLQQALTRYRELGNLLGEATALNGLGTVRRETGDYEQAIELQQRALNLHREFGNRLGEASTLTNLGIVQWHIGNYEQAAHLQQRAHTLFREIGHRVGETIALGSLGLVPRETGAYEQAADLYQHALNLFRELGNRLGEAETLNDTGKFLFETSTPGEALTMFTDAYTVARDIDSPLEQARALEGAAHCHAALGDTHTATTHLREAIAIYRHLGAPETDAATTYLATLESPDPAA